jgi:hypothetical protein
MPRTALAIDKRKVEIMVKAFWGRYLKNTPPINACELFLHRKIIIRKNPPAVHKIAKLLSRLSDLNQSRIFSEK